MVNLNKAQLIGRVGNDIELRHTQNNTAVANFSVATSDRYKDSENETQEETDWHDVTVWGNLAENCAEYISKGNTIYVEGLIKTKEWDDQDGNTRRSTFIKASTVSF